VFCSKTTLFAPLRDQRRLVPGTRDSDDRMEHHQKGRHPVVRSVSLMVLLVLNAALLAMPVQADCLKTCGAGGSFWASFGHRDCEQGSSACHVTACPCQRGSGCGYADPNETHNDLCMSNDGTDPWDCRDAILHFCFDGPCAE
jgi:hypothetical protein